MIMNTNEGQTTLGALNSITTAAATQAKAFSGHNLSRQTILLRMPVFDFYRQSAVANERTANNREVTQRPLDSKHARGLSIYLMKGLIHAAQERRNQGGMPPSLVLENMLERLGPQPYFGIQPIVANLRTAGQNGETLQVELLKTDKGEPVGIRTWLGQQDILWIVDGQHRRYGMQILLEFLEGLRTNRRYPPKKDSLYPFEAEDRDLSDEELNAWLECYEVARMFCSVSVEVHLGLDPDQERQLFHDLNRLGKKVDTNLALQFDNSNPVNSFIKHELLEKGLIQVSNDTGRDAASVAEWGNDTGGLKRKELVAVNSILLMNKGNPNGATPVLVNDRLGIAKRFWDAVSQIEGFGEHGARKKTVAAQPVVLKALAKLAYDFAFGRLQNDEHLERLLDRITEVDFSHVNPMWRYYEMSEEERVAACLSKRVDGRPGLDEYLPPLSTGNRDVGTFNEAHLVMIFGAKHNDIFPLLGDMIRWSLELPPREHKITAQDGALVEA